MAEADVAVAEADVKIAQAKLEQTRTLQAMTNLVAPIDGVITERMRAVGDLILSTDALFVVQRTDILRVVASIADRDAPFINIGDSGELQIGILPEKKWGVKIARTASSLDPQKRTMRVEFDLPNPNGFLRPGMHGTVTLTKNR
jgi:RND family efflux transporter MFP subunit